MIAFFLSLLTTISILVASYFTGDRPYHKLDLILTPGLLGPAFLVIFWAVFTALGKDLQKIRRK